MAIEENEEIGLFWKPGTQSTPTNEYVFEKDGKELEQGDVQDQDEETPVETSERKKMDVSKTDDEKLKHQRSVKLTDSEDEFISMVKTATGTKNTAEAIRWCVRKIREEYEGEVKRIAKKKERIGTL